MSDVHANATSSWRRFLDEYEPLRPDLYRYCRHLTRTPWDAEDMVQDALARAFVMLATMRAPPANPRAWLFRVASNAWLNRLRDTKREVLVDDSARTEPSTSPDMRATREAAGTLLQTLAPQERAAVVLKDAFGLQLDEIADALSTTTGAVKSALHRARAKLSDTTARGDEEHTPKPAVLDAFCRAFDARDLDALTALLLDHAVLEYPGQKREEGAREIRDGTFHGTLVGCDDVGGLIAHKPRCDARFHRGEWLLLWWAGEVVESVVRVVVDESGRIASLRDYYHCPDVVAEVCRELGVPFQTHGYRIGRTP